jgi:CMP-N,N'-diacetyllegionaminic acid synthase
MDILITLCARGGSKGIPGKNIRLLANRPLIDYSIKVAQKFAESNNGTVCLSTDDQQIKEVAASCGLITSYTRPDYLASDSAGKVDTIKDIVFFEEKRQNKKFDFILDLDVTSPLRTLTDLEEAFINFISNEDALTLFSVNNANRNPYFNMVEQKENGYYYLVKQLQNVTLTRQSAPKVFELNASFYFYRRAFFEHNFKSIFTEKSMVYTMPHLCFDLDHPIDFDFMEFLISNKKLDFIFE